MTYVRGGDTIQLGSRAIRFWGIAAPEWDAPGGQETTDAIKDMVLGKQVRRGLTDNKTYDRCVGACYLDGVSIEEELVGIGLAATAHNLLAVEVEQAAAVQGGHQGNIQAAGYCRAR